MLRKLLGDFYGLDHRVVVGPGFFEAMSELLNGFGASFPHQKPCCRCTESTHQPNCLLHCCHSLLLSYWAELRARGYPVECARGRPYAVIQKQCLRMRCSAGVASFAEALHLRTMDRVRFGRALGYGARHAAKTLAAAVEAATAPDPRRPGGATDAGSAGAGAPAGERARGGFQETVARVETVRRSAPQVAAQAKGVGRSVWKPLARFSSVLWLEVTGTFFTLIAVFVASGAWKLRGAIH
jgi:hypothetical protein